MPHYFTALPEMLVRHYLTLEKKQDRGFYGLPGAREVAVELINNIPSNEIIEGFEVHDFRGSSQVDSRIKSLE